MKIGQRVHRTALSYFYNFLWICNYFQMKSFYKNYILPLDLLFFLQNLFRTCQQVANWGDLCLYHLFFTTWWWRPWIKMEYLQNHLAEFGIGQGSRMCSHSWNDVFLKVFVFKWSWINKSGQPDNLRCWLFANEWAGGESLGAIKKSKGDFEELTQKTRCVEEAINSKIKMIQRGSTW